MSATATLNGNGSDRAAAAAVWLTAAATGERLNGTQLAERFDRSPRWGREVIREARLTVAGASVDEDGAQQVERARRPWQDTVITLVVALVAAAASYGHMYDVALMAGEPLWIARAWPITVDGLALAALRRGEAGRGWLALSLAVSVAANVVAQYPEWATAAGPAVSAWPPLALYGTHRLTFHQRSPVDVDDAG